MLTAATPLRVRATRHESEWEKDELSVQVKYANDYDIIHEYKEGHKHRERERRGKGEGER
jgi:hypothetical protein